MLPQEPYEQYYNTYAELDRDTKLNDFGNIYLKCKGHSEIPDIKGNIAMNTIGEAIVFLCELAGVSINDVKLKDHDKFGFEVILFEGERKDEENIWCGLLDVKNELDRLSDEEFGHRNFSEYFDIYMNDCFGHIERYFK